MSQGNSSIFDPPQPAASLHQAHLCLSCRWLELTDWQAGRDTATQKGWSNTTAREAVDSFFSNAPLL